MRSAVIYSSVTGNTRKVAEAIFNIMPDPTVLLSVDEDPDPDNYDFLALGFWVRRASPDPKMVRYMKRVQGKYIGLFGTLGAYPDSEHANKTLLRARQLVSGNEVLGSFLCQGKLSLKLEENMDQNPKRRKTHPLTPARIAQRAEAAKHPNTMDFLAAQAKFAKLATKAQRLQKEQKDLGKKLITKPLF